MWSFEKFVGCCAASFFSLAYYYVGIYLLSCVVICIWYPGIWSLASFAPLGISFLFPVSRFSAWILRTYFFRCILKYFDYDEVLEISHSEVKKIEESKKIIFAAVPHGVMSFCGMCHGIKCADEGYNIPPTAAASVILKIPILRNIFGLYGLIDASKKSLIKQLKKGSVLIYIGGMAELFLSSPTREELHLNDRKGFIKLAMVTGSEVVPVYFIGNTSGLRVLRSAALSRVSRALGASVTWTWGLLGLPVPRPDKMVSVRGRPLGIPKIDNPTQEDIDKWHAKYVGEVKRLFEKYKVTNPNYVNKELIIS
mmetsp:Transcript_22506/g.35563  ORF Transcript_22506/g.35563 Transcript_22506/m.35563 type:complete len:310 (+) Transcript_22506:34-963(+)